MLQTKTVEPKTLSLLNDIMELSAMADFSLVGGTALSLKYGHRRSIDLDFFCHKEFDMSNLIHELETFFGSRFMYEKQQTGFGLFCFIDSIKVDIIHYPFNLINPPVLEENIRMYDDADIAAMKIQAILGRGTKKDFWDVYELLYHHSLNEMINWHNQKYPNQMLAISIPHALTYFTDADESEPPVSFKNQTWEKVKKGIQSAVREYLR